MQLEGIKCPACNNECKLSFVIADEDKTEWIFCSCGSLFHQKRIDKKYFDEKYLTKYINWKVLPERFEYLERVYLPIIEELTYGRRFLDVGFGIDYHLKNMKKRGWITQGIDLIKNNYIQGDFEEYNFGIDKFDFILMGQVLESFHNPIKALYKAKELLFPRGILMLIGADAELIYSKGMFAFGHWDAKEKAIIFGEIQIKKILDKLNFNVILSYKNLEKRFLSWNTYHLIAQKRNE